MTTALIVDDESPARNLMADLLRAHPRVEVIGMAASVAEAVRFVRTRPPDLIFLDVDMPGGHGFDLIPALEKKTHLVFVTAHERFALDAFGVGATDYLVKPVAPARLAVTLERVAQFPPQAGEAPDLAAAPGPATPTTASIRRCRTSQVATRSETGRMGAVWGGGAGTAIHGPPASRTVSEAKPASRAEDAW